MTEEDIKLVGQKYSLPMWDLRSSEKVSGLWSCRPTYSA